MLSIQLTYNNPPKKLIMRFPLSLRIKIHVVDMGIIFGRVELRLMQVS